MSFVLDETIVPSFWAIYKDIKKCYIKKETTPMLCAAVIISALIIRDAITDASHNICEVLNNE